MDKITINAQEYAWVNVEAYILGQKLFGITGVDYKSKKNKTPLFASGVRAKALQHGKREYDGTLTILQSEFIALNKSAKAAGYTDLLDIEFSIIVKYATEQGAVTIDKVCCASFTELPSSMKEGDPSMTVALPFLALDIKYNLV